MICQSISFVTCPCRLRRTMTSLYYGRLNTCSKVVTYKVMEVVLMVYYCYICLTLWIMFFPACMSGGRCCSVCVSEWEEWQEDGIEQDKSMRCLSKEKCVRWASLSGCRVTTEGYSKRKWWITDAQYRRGFLARFCWFLYISTICDVVTWW